MKKIVFVLFFTILLFPNEVLAGTTPVGWIDSVNIVDSKLQITGWAVDPDDQDTGIDVHFYVDGPAGSGTGLGIITANIPRVLPYRGNHHYIWTGEIPERLKDGKYHKVYAHGIDITGDTNALLLPAEGFSFSLPFPVETDLTSLGIKKFKIETTYINDNIVGLGPPNYEYSGHIMKMPTSPYYRMFYGARCFYDANRDCQVPVNGQYPNPNPVGGDGDHIKYAESDDGVRWNAQETKPIIRPGRFDIPWVPASNYDWNNQMDPTVIEWNGTYYMYYQKQVESEVTMGTVKIDRSMLCPKTQDDRNRDCSKILLATSKDLKIWTKDNSFQPVIENALPESNFGWPKALVYKDEIWLFFPYSSSWIYNLGDEKPQESGAYLIKSKDPTAFDFNARIKLFNPQSPGAIPVGGQKAVLWPNDPQKTLFVGMDMNWNNGAWPTNKNPRVPTLLFSKNGVNWIYNDKPRVDHPPSGDVVVGEPIDFPPAMRNINNVFCNIATDVNGGLNPIAGNKNRIETFYYCSTFDGGSREGVGSVWDANISVGKIAFEASRVDILDLRQLLANPSASLRTLIFDYNKMVEGFGR